MTTIHVTGTITEDGELKAKLPISLPPGEIQFTIEIPDLDETWTREELDEALTFHPATGAEIVASGVVGAWADEGIADSAAWVEDLRRKQQDRLKWRR